MSSQVDLLSAFISLPPLFPSSPSTSFALAPLSSPSLKSLTVVFQKKAAYVVHHHEDSISKALLDLFPEIGIDQHLFDYCMPTLLPLSSFSLLSPPVYPLSLPSPSHLLHCPQLVDMAPKTSSPVMRRKFFETYARKKGFDPLIPENWYRQSRTEIRSAKVCFSSTFLFFSFLYISLLIYLY